MSQPRRRRFPPAVQAAVILAALVAIFLGRPILHGQWYLPADLTQISGAATHPAGTTPHLQNGLESDPATQMDPWWHYDRQELHAGRLPTWNPNNALGVPQLANYQAGFFSPYSIPFYVLPLRWAFLVAAGLKLWTLSFFAYLFFRRARLSHLASLLGSVVYGFGAYHLLWLNWQHVGAAICLPAGAWAACVALQADTTKVRRRGFAALSLAVGAAVLAGHPETLYWSVLTLAVTLLWALKTQVQSWAERGVRAVQLLGAAALGAALGAVQLLPFEEYLKVSTEYAMRSGQGTGGGLGKEGLPLLAFPDTLGNPSLSYHEPTYLLGNYNEANGDYVGLIAMGLAILGLVSLWRRGPRRDLAVLGTVVSVAGFALFHVSAVSTFTTKTPILKLATVNRSHDVWIFGVAVLAALGMQVAIEGLTASKRWQPRIARGFAVALVTVGGVALSVHGFHALRRDQAAVAGNLASTALARHTVRTHVEWVLGCTLLAAAAVVLLMVLRPRSEGRAGQVAGPVLVAVVVAAQFGITGGMLRGYNPSLPSSLVYPLTPAYQAAIDFTGNDLSIKDGSTFALPDTNLWWRTPQLTSYDALGVVWYDKLFSAVFHEETSEFFDEGTPTCLANLQLFGVRYIWSTARNPLPPGSHGNNTTNVVGPDVRGFGLARQFGNINVFNVPGSTGRFTVVHRTQTVSSDAQAISEVSSCTFDPNSTAVLLSSGKGAATGPRATSGSASSAPTQQVDVLVDQPEHLRLRVAAGPGGELVLRQTWFPGWEATVDGRSAPIDRVDEAMRGVPLGSGSHIVDMSYHPESLREGAVVTALAALGAGVLALGAPIIPARLRRRHDAAGWPKDTETPS